MVKKAGVKHSSLESYPEVFWEILKAAEKGEDFILPFPAKNYAVNARHRFHYFRLELIRQSFPGATKLTNFNCSIKEVNGECLLHFFNLGAVFEVKKEEEEEQLPILERTKPVKIKEKEVDAGDEAVRNWMKQMGGKIQDAEEASKEFMKDGECQHEWGDFCCLKCGIPNPE